MTETPSGCAIAVVPASRGFGYVVVDSAGKLVAWAAKETREHKNARCVAEVDALITLHRATTLILEDCRSPESRRQKRVCELLAALQELAQERAMELVVLDLTRVRAVLGVHRGGSKDDIFAAVARAFPALAAKVPRRRRQWDTERYAAPIFLAAALCLCHKREAQSDAQCG